MKKLLIAACMLLGFGSIASAQTPAATTSKVKTSHMKMVKKDSTGKVVKMQKVKPQTTAGVKADGTPDMRYKANKNKTTTVPAGPKKKDGTADMRYKANKVKAAPAPATAN